MTLNRPLGNNQEVNENLSKKISFVIVQSNFGLIQAELQLPADWPYFEGHFPGNPVLPAVSIIDLSVLLLRRQNISVATNQLEISKSKFLGKVRPGQTVVISAQSTDHINWLVHWDAKSDMARLAQIQLTITH